MRKFNMQTISDLFSKSATENGMKAVIKVDEINVIIALGTTQIMILRMILKMWKALGIDIPNLKYVFIAIDSDDFALKRIRELQVGVKCFHLSYTRQELEDFINSPEYESYIKHYGPIEGLPIPGQGGTGGQRRAINLAYTLRRSEIKEGIRGAITAQRRIVPGGNNSENKIVVVHLIVGGSGSTNGCSLALKIDLDEMLKKMSIRNPMFEMFLISPNTFQGVSDIKEKMKNFVSQLLELSAAVSRKVLSLPYGKFKLNPCEYYFILGASGESGSFISPNAACLHYADILSAIFSPLNHEWKGQFKTLMLNRENEAGDTKNELFRGEPSFLYQLNSAKLGINIQHQERIFILMSLVDILDELITGSHDAESTESDYSPSDDGINGKVSLIKVRRELDLNGIFSNIVFSVYDVIFKASYVEKVMKSLRDSKSDIDGIINRIRNDMNSVRSDILSEFTVYIKSSSASLEQKLNRLNYIKSRVIQQEILSALDGELERCDSEEKAISKIEIQKRNFLSTVIGLLNWFKLLLGFKQAAKKSMNSLNKSCEGYLKTLFKREEALLLKDFFEALLVDFELMIDELSYSVGVFKDARNGFISLYNELISSSFNPNEDRIATQETLDKYYHDVFDSNKELPSIIISNLLTEIGSDWRDLNRMESPKEAVMGKLLTLIHRTDLFSDIKEKLGIYALLSRSGRPMGEIFEDFSKLDYLTNVDVNLTKVPAFTTNVDEITIVVIPNGPGFGEVELQSISNKPRSSIQKSNTDSRIIMTCAYGPLPINLFPDVTSNLGNIDMEHNPYFITNYIKNIIRNPMGLSVRFGKDMHQFSDDILSLFIIAWALLKIKRYKGQWKSNGICLGDNIGEVLKTLNNNASIRKDLMQVIQVFEKRLTEKEIGELQHNLILRERAVLKTEPDMLRINGRVVNISLEFEKFKNERYKYN